MLSATKFAMRTHLQVSSADMLNARGFGHEDLACTAVVCEPVHGCLIIPHNSAAQLHIRTSCMPFTY